MGPSGLSASVRSASSVQRTSIKAYVQQQVLQVPSAAHQWSFLSRFLTGSLMFEYAPEGPFFAVSLWFIFQTVFCTPRAPQRHSLITICELFPEGFLLPHLKPHNYSAVTLAIKQQQYLQTEDKAPASPREGGLMPQPTALLSPAPEISVPMPPVPGAKPSMRLQK